MSAQCDSLVEQFAALEQQMAALRTSVKVQRGVLVLFMVLSVLALGLGGRGLHASAQGEKGAMEITCKALKVVDEQGKVRVQLTYDKYGGIVSVNNPAEKTVATMEADNDGGFVSIAGTDGKQRVFVGVGPKLAGGMISIHDDKGKQRGLFTVYPDGHGGLAFRNDQGKNEVFLGPSTKGWGGVLNLNGPDGKSRVIVDIDKDGRGVMEILNADAKSEVFIGTSAKGWGGLFNLNGPGGTAGVILDVDDGGRGRLNLRNKDAKRFLFAGGDQEGGTISLYGYDVKERMFLGVADKAGAGMLHIMSPDNNKSRVVMAVDNNGVGSVEGRDAEGTTKRLLR